MPSARPTSPGSRSPGRPRPTSTATQGLALYAADRYLRLGLNWRCAAAGLAVSALTHYVVDRCAGHWPEDDDQAPLLVRAAHATGKGEWLKGDPGAPSLIDQALHKGCLVLAAAVAAGPTH